MKKNNSIQSSSIFRSIMLLLMVAFGCANASAIEWKAIELGEEVEVKMFTDLNCTFTAPETGVLKLVTVSGSAMNDYVVSTGPEVVFPDESGKGGNIVPTSWSYPTDYEPAILSFAVEKDQTYYISISFPMSSWTFVPQMADKFELLGTKPVVGEKLAVTAENNVTFYFPSSADIFFTTGEVVANGNEVKIYNFIDYNDLVRKGIFTYTESGMSGMADWNGNLCAHAESGAIIVPMTTQTGTGYYNVLNKLFEEGKLQAGDEITVNIHGVKDQLSGELLNGDGELSATWEFAGAPTTIVSANIPNPILSWYNPGDENALATFTFTRDISKAKASLEMGQGDGADDLYVEEIADDKISIDGAVVTVDLSGKRRTYSTMGLNMQWEDFRITLYGVVDIDGNDAYSDDLGSASSYTYSVKYKNVEGDLSFEFTPAPGTQLTADDEEVEIWFNNSELIQWDGVVISYENAEGKQTQTLAKDELDVTVEGDETVVIVPLAEEIRLASNVIVKLNVTASADGLEHSIEALYNESAVEYDIDLVPFITPTSGSVLTELKELDVNLGYTYCIMGESSEAPVINSVPVTVSKKGEEGFVTSGQFVRDGMTNLKIVFNQAITEEGEYFVDINKGHLGDYTYGESEYRSGHANAQCTLTYTIMPQTVDITPILTPEAGSSLSKIEEILLTYPEEVTLVEDCWEAPYIADADGYLAVAGEMLQVSETEVIFVTFEPLVKEGNYTFVLPSGNITVNGKSLPKFTAEYYVDGSEDVVIELIPGGDPTIVPEEGKVESLQTFVVTFEGWAGWMATEEYPVIKNADGEVVATCWNGMEMDFDAWNRTTLNFEEAITDEGDYTLVVPVLVNDATWTLIEEHQYEFHYTVVSTAGIAQLVNNAGGRADIYNADGKLILRHADAAAAASLRPGLYIINGKKVVLK